MEEKKLQLTQFPALEAMSQDELLALSVQEIIQLIHKIVVVGTQEIQEQGFDSPALAWWRERKLKALKDGEFLADLQNQNTSAIDLLYSILDSQQALQRDFESPNQDTVNKLYNQGLVQKGLISLYEDGSFAKKHHEPFSPKQFLVAFPTEIIQRTIVPAKSCCHAGYVIHDFMPNPQLRRLVEALLKNVVQAPVRSCVA